MSGEQHSDEPVPVSEVLGDLDKIIGAQPERHIDPDQVLAAMPVDEDEIHAQKEEAVREAKQKAEAMAREATPSGDVDDDERRSHAVFDEQTGVFKEDPKTQ